MNLLTNTSHTTKGSNLKQQEKHTITIDDMKFEYTFYHRAETKIYRAK